jgi:hypothetical protein
VTDPWEVVATGGTAQSIDESELARAAKLLLVGSRHEVRSLPSARHRYVAGKNAAALVAAARDLADDRAIYFTINPVAAERDGSARNGDILERLWFFLDIDPIKGDPEGSATDAEKNAAVQLTWAVDEHLAGIGWPAPMVIDSGNGHYLLYRTDLPNDNLSRALVSSALKVLAEMFGCEGARIDKAVHNAARIARLPGTMNCKGTASVERPHRMCRIVHVPGAMELLTIDQIRSLASEGKPKAESPKADPWVAQAGTGALDAYLRRALEGELLRVAMSPEGERNNQLNKSAFACGQLVPHGLTKFEVVQGLTQAAKRAGLPEKEIQQTVVRGVDDGIGQPRALPESLVSRASTQSEASPKASLDRLTIGAHEITPKSVRWLWNLRVPIGFISLFAGQTGQGKSFVTCDLAARLSRGDDLPDHPGDHERRGTLFISEDPYEYVLAPRLIELGADLNRVRFMTWEAMADYSIRDTDMLERAFAECGSPSLVVIDPPTNFLSAKDEHKNTEVRQILMRLVAWLQAHDAACILITHLNKPGKGTDAISRIVGSIAWATTCRVACQFYPDPDDESRSLLASPKNNLGPRAKTLAYAIKSTDTLATVEWLGEVDITAEQANSGEKRTPRRVLAAEFLEEQFRIKRSWLSDDLYVLGRGHGVSRSAIFEAKKELPIRAFQNHPQDGAKPFWLWEAHPGWPPEFQPDENTETVKF